MLIGFPGSFPSVACPAEHCSAVCRVKNGTQHPSSSKFIFLPQPRAKPIFHCHTSTHPTPLPPRPGVCYVKHTNWGVRRFLWYSPMGEIQRNCCSLRAGNNHGVRYLTFFAEPCVSPERTHRSSRFFCAPAPLSLASRMCFHSTRRDTVHLAPVSCLSSPSTPPRYAKGRQQWLILMGGSGSARSTRSAVDAGECCFSLPPLSTSAARSLKA